MNNGKTIAFLLGTLFGVLVGVLVVSSIFIVASPRLTTQMATAPQPAQSAAVQVKPTAYPPAAAPVSDQAVSGGALEGKVSIANQTFSPHTLIVATGAQITWKNEDTMNHTVTSARRLVRQQKRFHPAGRSPGRPTSPAPSSITATFTRRMEGVIIVQPGGAVAAPLFGGKPINQFFADTCGGCHGPHREGGTGPALIPDRLTSDDDFYFKTIKNGRPGTVMPAWGQAGITDDEIWALIGFVRSEPKAEDVKWELPQIAASRAVLVDEKTLPDKPTHSGNLNNLMLVTEREARKIAVIDGDTNKLLGHIDASYRAHGYTFDETTDRWAYNVGRDGWLFKIDLYTLQAVTKVRVGLDSRGIAISDDGKWVIVGNYVPNTAVILKADTLEPVKVIYAEGNDPQGKFVKSRICIVSDVSPKLVGPYFVIALKEAGQMWRIDWSKPDFPIEKVEGVGNILHDGFLSPDNKLFYIASQKDNWMGVIDVVNWKLVDKISTGTTPHPGSGAAWTASDGHVYGATVHAGEGKIAIWDLSNNKMAGTIKTDGPGLFIRSSDKQPVRLGRCAVRPAGQQDLRVRQEPAVQVGQGDRGRHADAAP